MVELSVKWVFFQKSVLKYNLKDKSKKKSLVGVTGEEIFRFN